MSENERQLSREPAGVHPLEDRALKEAARLFGEELMPLLGVKGKIRRVAPTEQVYLNPKDFMEDFNYEMMDGSWVHLEFESDRIRIKDLRRFRTYEAVTSQNYEVDVITCVICSAGVKKPRNRLVTGINTYHVKVLGMKDKDAERILRKLERRQKNGCLNRTDLLELLLTPLMSGEISQQERITRGMALLKGEREHVEPGELARMEAVLYTFAMKFLKTPQLRKLKEMMNMTILGEMILQDGIEKGRKEGKKEGIRIGEDAIIRLNSLLIRTDRMEDLKRATEDREYRERLMAELFPERDDRQDDF